LSRDVGNTVNRFGAERRNPFFMALIKNSEQGDTMIETYILRRNIERFRQMLADETDESNRHTIERMIREFEGMLSLPEPERRPGKENQRSSDRVEKG